MRCCAISSTDSDLTIIHVRRQIVHQRRFDDVIARAAQLGRGVGVMRRPARGAAADLLPVRRFAAAAGAAGAVDVSMPRQGQSFSRTEGERVHRHGRLPAAVESRRASAGRACVDYEMAGKDLSISVSRARLCECSAAPARRLTMRCYSQNTEKSQSGHGLSSRMCAKAAGGGLAFESTHGGPGKAKDLHLGSSRRG